MDQTNNASSFYVYQVPTAPAQVVARRAPVPSRVLIIMFIIGYILLGFSIFFTSIAVKAHRMNLLEHRQEISLANFSVSNLSIIDGQISGSWTIGLSFENPARQTVVYTDIESTVALSTAPDVTIVDYHLGYPTVQPPKNRAVVYFHGSAEKLGLSHLMAGSMTQDVIDGAIVDFDVLLVAKYKNEGLLGSGRLELSCNGIGVLFSPSKSASANATGSATQIPACDLVRSRVKYEL